MIELKNISVNFGKHQVIKEMNITFESGEVVGLVAPNGTGKSTMLNVMMNYLKPQNGEIVINETKRYKNPKENSQIYQLISMMPDQNDLYEHLSGYDHLKLYQKMWRNKDMEITDVVERLQMKHYIKQRVGGYSLGMKQRLCFAMQLMTNTSIMLMDEVMNGLDPNNVELISKVILEKKEEGKTIIIASHLLENLEKYADRIFFLFSGELELFLDKKQGYTDQGIYIKLENQTINKIQEMFPHLYTVMLNNQEVLIKLNEKEQLATVLEELIKNDIINFSVGFLSLSDAYQLKF